MLARTMLKTSCITATIACLTACGTQEFAHKPVYDVDPLLEPYIMLFEQKAFEQQMSIEVNDIRIYFVSDLGEDEDSITLAVCKKYQSEDGRTLASPEIEVDKKEFDELSDLRKEALMLHELGHCVLNREHNDARISQEENRYESLMNTYLVGTYYYNKYYSSYIYELFHGR